MPCMATGPREASAGDLGEGGVEGRQRPGALGLREERIADSAHQEIPEAGAGVRLQVGGGVARVRGG